MLIDEIIKYNIQRKEYKNGEYWDLYDYTINPDDEYWDSKGDSYIFIKFIKDIYEGIVISINKIGMKIIDEGDNNVELAFEYDFKHVPDVFEVDKLDDEFKSNFEQLLSSIIIEMMTYGEIEKIKNLRNASHGIYNTQESTV